jgi:plastocyanin
VNARVKGGAPFAALAALAALGVAAPALADQEISAAPVDSYADTDVSIAQGERLTFRNGDLSDHHDVTSKAKGRDGGPLFNTPVLAPGESHLVDGSQFLTAGTYSFFCSIHPFMTGSLRVTGTGSPLPRPPDTKPPAVRLAIASGKLRRALKRRRLRVRVKVNEKASVALSATAKVGRRKVRLGKSSVNLSGPGSTTARLRLGRRARRVLRRRRRARFAVTGTARDPSGNTKATTVRRTLRR